MDAKPAMPTGVVILEPRVFSHERADLYESYNKLAFVEDTGFDDEFVQDNLRDPPLGEAEGLRPVS